MSKTYRSLFLACSACKLGVEGEAKYCNHCGRAIWRKDVNNTPAPPPDPIDIPIEEPVRETAQRARLQKEFGTWLPIIFPEYYYVAPNPMPKQTLEFLVHHMGRELVYNINILGYGFDSMNNRVYVFSDDAMYYKSTGAGMLFKLLYSSIKEVEAGNGQIIIRTDLIGTKELSASREVALAEMLGVVSGANLKLHSSNSAMGMAGFGNSMINGGGQANWNPPINNHPIGTSVQKINYSVNDYMRDNPGLIRSLLMLAVRICLGMQCFVCFSTYDYTDSMGALVCAVLFGIFALAISYQRPWLMVICWFFPMLVFDEGDWGTKTSQSEWHLYAFIWLTIALVIRFFIGRKYKRYMASGMK